MSRRIEYTASKTLALFHRSRVQVRGVMGPVGSGKSTAMCWELHRRGREQAPGPDGVRRTRFAVVRNTYRELKDTTLKTWLDWFPEEVFGHFRWSDMQHRIRMDDVDMEILFRALDRPSDISKLLSLELTGAWFNEAREIPLSLVMAMHDRLERYPSRREGGCTWAGLIMDTNPPDTDHWWYALAERDPEALARLNIDPEFLLGWDFFRQPGGIIERNGRFEPNPDAENLGHLPQDFYSSKLAGKSRDHIRVYYCGRYGFVQDGRPVYPEFHEEVHVAREDLKPVPGVIIHVGIDFGLTPAALLAQRLPNGRWQWLDEIVTENTGAVRFAEMLKAKLACYPDFEFEIWGDPAGEQRSQVDERTPFQILAVAGVKARPAPTNDPTIRREAVAGACARLIAGKPGLLVSPKCHFARKGMAGGYHYRRIQVSGSERYQDRPDKNLYSHVCDAGQYLMVGAGEGRRVIRSGRDSGPRQERADMGFSISIHSPAGAGSRQQFAD
ncbi:MAG: hypothetical protein PHV85_00455 [Desulfovibrionaceae bacterium]|nr:hypothetical protein [Desulfovibrionaceae bacterium]